MAELEISHTASMAAEDLGAVFTSLRGSLRSYLRKRVSDPALVEDLMQEVFVKASAAISAQRAPQNLTGWLYAAARTTVVDHYRSYRPDTTEFDDTLADSPAVNDESLHQELALCLRPLAEELPAIYRETLIATDFENKTMQVVADEQGLSLSAIKSRASRARAMLKEKVLGCCHVETADGFVTDYHQHDQSRRCRGPG